MKELKEPYKYSAQEVLNALGVSPDRGLSEEEVRERELRYGKNVLRKAKPKSPWIILANQFRSLIVLLLVVAAALSFAFGDTPEAIAVIIVLLINSAIGFTIEIKAVRSMEALHELVRLSTRVRRGGHTLELPSQDLVPGDIVILEAGDIVPADMRLIKASRIESDESSLTGESVPVPKQLNALPEDTTLAECSNMAFMGTPLTRGSGEGVVTATGVSTEIGRISLLVESATKESTPLEKRLDSLGHKLIAATIVVAAFVIVSGTLRGKGLLLMIETGIALAVAAIPEGLPVVATIALARGMMRMARRNALINRLSAVETLGSTGVICTDKTGTLTENKMRVELIATDGVLTKITQEQNAALAEFISDGHAIDPLDDEALRRTIEVGVLCNTATITATSEGPQQNIGDPLEIALLLAGAKAGVSRQVLLSRYPETRLEAFDTSVNMMATFHKVNGSYLVAVKGAPDSVLMACGSVLKNSGAAPLSEEMRTQWLTRNDELGEKGYRVIAHAYKYEETDSAPAYQDLTFLGLMCLLDPPRRDVRDAIKKCLHAGIRVVMITGDQPSTALNIAQALGLADQENSRALHGSELGNLKELSEAGRDGVLGAPVLARVSPEQKLDIVSMYQDRGLVVAMTGDGVNDAPALKQADIGIAMGTRGTQVAKEASDMVLKDDSFSTIVAAIEQGRVIFGNIRKFIYYLISCNVSEIFVVSAASFTEMPLPVLPLQILFLNLVTDVFPALALGVGEGDRNVMNSPPRDPDEPILTRRNWLGIGGYGVLMSLSVLGALLISIGYLGYEDERAVSVSFLTLAFVQLFHVFNMRDPGSGLIKNEVTRNPYVWGAILLCVILILLAVYIEPVASVLKVLDPGAWGWLVIISMSLVPLIVGQVIMHFKK
jgi:P-type Ca2+ transporter type 2C